MRRVVCREFDAALVAEVSAALALAARTDHVLAARDALDDGAALRTAQQTFFFKEFFEFFVSEAVFLFPLLVLFAGGFGVRFVLALGTLEVGFFLVHNANELTVSA